MRPSPSNPVHVFQILPSNIEAEQSYLGSVFLNNAVLDQAPLLPEDFRLDSHRKIFETMLEMNFRDRLPIDPVTLSDALAKKGWTGITNGHAYIEELSYIVPTACNAPHYALILKEKAALRKAALQASEMIEAVRNNDLERVERIRWKIGENPETSGADPFAHPLFPGEAFRGPRIPPVYVLPGLRPRTVGLIVATGGVGKSFLALEIGLARTSGCDLTGMGIEEGSGGVLVLAAEDPREILIERLQTLRDFLPPSALEKADGLEIHDLYGRMGPLVDHRGEVRHALVQALIRQGKGKDLIVLDTFRKFHDTDENDSGAVSAFLKVADRIALETGAAVVLLHHTNKVAGWNGRGGEKDAARGSSAISDNCRWQLNLVGFADKASGRSFVEATLAKVSYGKGERGFWMERKTGGVLIGCQEPDLGAPGGEPEEMTEGLSPSRCGKEEDHGDPFEGIVPSHQF